MAPRPKGSRTRANGRPRAAAASAAPTPITTSWNTPSITPISSAYTSAYPTEDEGDIENDPSTIKISALSIQEGSSEHSSAAAAARAKIPVTPFRFMDLPSELRLKVYAFHFSDIQDTVDLAPDNPQKIKKSLAIMRTCRQVRTEATHYLFSSHIFRIFPTHSGRPFKTKKPLLARLKPYQRHCLTTLEFRVGPGWGKPPRSWVVNPALGLADCINVRSVNVFVECDPSDDIFKGFRREGFYENFCRNLLNGILDGLPAVERVQFDAWSSVKKRGDMVQTLLDVATQKRKKICWGPERGWTDGDDDSGVEPGVLLDHGGNTAVWAAA